MTYALDGDHIVGPNGRYYLREVVDPYCAEYDASTLTDDQRREVFDIIGSEALTAALEKLYAEQKHFDGDEAIQTIKLAQWRLR